MSKRSSGHGIEVTLSVAPHAPEERAEASAPFCVALLGDFSARSHRGIVESGRALARRTPIPIDRDTVDEVIASLQPELHLQLERDREPLRIRFTELEDFHPDRLYERVPVFEGARELRNQLTRAGGAAAARGPSLDPPPAGTGSLLDQIVARSRAPSERSPLEGGDLQTYLNRLVAPHLVPGADPQRQSLIAELDAATSDGMRTLLHLREFQALEALWRGVSLLARQIESDADVRLYLVDVSKAELLADESTDSLAQTLAAGPPEGWGVLGGMYSFAAEPADLRLLGRLSVFAGHLGAPLIAAADPRFNPPVPAEEGWQALRRTPDARSIGLALPRVLLRSPYGEGGTRCEALSFEELPGAPVHEEYLWGNPAVACLALVARGVAQSGRSLSPGMDLELDGLPLHLVPAPGGTSSVPCAEAWLSESAAERLMDSGVMTLMSIRDADRVRLFRFQSIAHPAAALSGRWFEG